MQIALPVYEMSCQFFLATFQVDQMVQNIRLAGLQKLEMASHLSQTRLQVDQMLSDFLPGQFHVYKMVPDIFLAVFKE